MKTRLGISVFLVVTVVTVSMVGCAKRAEVRMRLTAEKRVEQAQPAEMRQGGAPAPSVAFKARGEVGSTLPESAGGGPPASAEFAGAASPVTNAGAVYAVPEQAALQVAVSQRKLISKAWRTVKVKDVEESYEKAVKLATQNGGFVESSSMEKGTEEKERKAELVLRIPATSLEKVIEEAGKLGEVLSTRMQGEDVTEQWVDLEARINNLRWEEEQLLKIMKERAKSLDDLLRMEREVARLRGEIEQNEGRMNLLREQVSLATLNLTLVEKEIVVEAVPSGSWALGSTFSHALRAALSGARSVVGFLIWFGMLGILWVPALVILFLLTRYAVRRAQRAWGQKTLSARADSGHDASK
jgi:hypothetical protein